MGVCRGVTLAIFFEGGACISGFRVHPDSRSNAPLHALCTQRALSAFYALCAMRVMCAQCAERDACAVCDARAVCAACAVCDTYTLCVHSARSASHPNLKIGH